MMDMIRNRRLAFVVVLLMAFALSGCDLDEPTPTPTPPPLLQGVACDAEIFGEFYEKMGGLSAMGPCISPLFAKHGLTYQYTQNALMVYNPNAPSAQQYSLGKICPDTVCGPEPIPDGGYDIWESVESLYVSTGGKFGLAVTDVLHDDDHQRYEQYFESVGFYQNDSDEPGTIHWMPYGLWFCGKDCEPYYGNSNVDTSNFSTPTPFVTPGTDEITRALVNYAERWGETFTGKPLSSVATLAEDGLYEFVFENVVLAVNPENLGEVTLRPLPEMQDIHGETPAACWAEEGLTCYLVTPELGFMVSNDFLDFIAQYGGWEVFGQPITALHAGQDGTSYQCFVNLCLEYRVRASAAQQVGVMPLGIAYYRRNTTAITTPDVPSSMLVIQTWPAYSLIPNGQAQEIYVEAIEGTQPVKGVLFSLSLTYPDGTFFEGNFPLTDASGQAILTLAPIYAPDGTNVPYMACFRGVQENPVCINGTFTIWSSAP